MDTGNIRLFMIRLIVIHVRLENIFFLNGPIFQTDFVHNSTRNFITKLFGLDIVHCFEVLM
jgi:hypothetical protein